MKKTKNVLLSMKAHKRLRDNYHKKALSERAKGDSSALSEFKFFYHNDCWLFISRYNRKMTKAEKKEVFENRKFDFRHELKIK